MTSRITYNNPIGHQSLGLPYHYEMVSDSSRVGPFKEAIFATCNGKRVLESGVGTGIQSILAAKAGAHHVYAVDIDETVLELAKQNIEKAGYDDVITLIHADMHDVSLEHLDGEPVDVVIAENLSTWQVMEPQLTIMNHVTDTLVKDSGVVLPQKIFNTVELVQTQYRFEDVVDIRTYFFEFTGVHTGSVLSEPQVVSEVDLFQRNDVDVQKSVIVEVATEGVLNSVRLTSPLQVFEDITFQSSDSLMPPIIFPLDDDIVVKPGDKIELAFSYVSPSSWESFNCTARKL